MSGAADRRRRRRHHTLEIEISVGRPMKRNPNAQPRCATAKHAGHLAVLEHATLGRVFGTLQGGGDATSGLHGPFHWRLRHCSG